MNMTRKTYLFLLGLLLLLPLRAQESGDSQGTLESGMRAYSEAKYAEAAEIFEQAITESEHPSDKLLYNLGNAYFKQGEYAKALLNYQRAYRLNPSDSDIRHNIRITRSKTVDRMEPKATFFLNRWIDSITHWFGLRGWMAIGLLFFGLSVTGILLYFLSYSRKLRLGGFYGAILGLLLCIFANLMVYRSHRFTHDTTGAIITQAMVMVKTSPDLSSEDMMVVHSGMEVKVIQNLSGLSEVEFPDGSIGWIDEQSYELINNI